MSDSPPDYHLRRIPTDQRDEQMEILDHSTESEPDRRKFLAVLMLIMEEFRSTTAVAAGQKDGEKSKKVDSDDDSSTDESEKPAVGWGNQWLIAAHRKAVTALAVSADGKFLATASLDSTVKIWEMPGGLLRKWWPDGRLVKSLPARRGDIRAICFTGGQNTLAAMVDDSDIQLLNFPPRGRTPDLQNSRELSSVAAISGDGHRLGVATNTGQIQFWDLPDRKPVAEIDCQASAMALSPEGRLAIRGGHNGLIQLWSMEDGRIFFERLEDTRATAAVSVCARPMSVAWAQETQIFVVKLSETEKIVELSGQHRLPITSLALSPDGRYLVSGDRDGVVVIWDLSLEKAIAYLFDPTISAGDATAFQIPVEGQTSVLFTLPCGSPTPPGATCVCNCVPGVATRIAIEREAEQRRLEREQQLRWQLYWSMMNSGVNTGVSGGSSCTCNTVCTCNLVYN